MSGAGADLRARLAKSARLRKPEISGSRCGPQGWGDGLEWRRLGNSANLKSRCWTLYTRRAALCQQAKFGWVHFKLGADRATASRCNDCKVHLRGLHPETEMHPIRVITYKSCSVWGRDGGRRSGTWPQRKGLRCGRRNFTQAARPEFVTCGGSRLRHPDL